MFDNELFDLRLVNKKTGIEDKVKYIGKYEVVLESGVIATYAGLNKYYKSIKSDVAVETI